jgi:hypothetical protein
MKTRVTELRTMTDKPFGVIYDPADNQRGRRRWVSHRVNMGTRFRRCSTLQSATRNLGCAALRTRRVKKL